MAQATFMVLPHTALSWRRLASSTLMGSWAGTAGAAELLLLLAAPRWWAVCTSLAAGAAGGAPASVAAVVLPGLPRGPPQKGTCWKLE
eukprot:207867-Lingulodinium_polyedra.AAC.1